MNSQPLTPTGATPQEVTHSNGTKHLTEENGHDDHNKDDDDKTENFYNDDQENDTESEDEDNDDNVKGNSSWNWSFRSGTKVRYRI